MKIPNIEDYFTEAVQIIIRDIIIIVIAFA